MARRHVNTTKHEIIQTATNLFVEKGYSATTPKLICDTLDISTGNLTYYFPTKEHLLAVLVEMLCRFQGKLMQDTVNEGDTTLLAVCLELATMASVSESNAIAKDLFLSAYSSPMCLDIIRKHDTQRSKRIYSAFCPDWNEQQYMEAEILVSGVEYATLATTTNNTISLEMRITGALNNIMMIYNVPEQIRSAKISKVLSMDYQTLGNRVLEQFRQFVNQTNEQAFEILLGGTQK